MRELLAGSVALVTGASRGIGRAISLDLARHGARVAINYRKSEESAEQLRHEIEQFGGIATCVRADVTSESEVRQLFKTTSMTLGDPSIVVNNAGVTADGLASMMSLRKWRLVLEADLDGVFLCCRQAMRVMTRNRRGAIVNVASISGLFGTPGQVNYSAAKGGVIALTKTLAKEGGPMGIRVNAVAPGLVRTDMIQTLPREMVDRYIEMVPMGRIGTPEDVSSVVTFLASDNAQYVSGQTIAIDGGLGMM